MLNLSAVWAHSSGYSIASQQYSSFGSVSMCAGEAGQAMDSETLSFLQSYFKQFAVSAWQSRHSSSPTAAGGFRFHFSFLSSFFLFPLHEQGILPGSAGVRVSVQVFWKKKRKGHCLWRSTGRKKKLFWEIAVTRPSLNTQFADLAGSTVKCTIITLDSAAWEMAGRPRPRLTDTATQATIN